MRVGIPGIGIATIHDIEATAVEKGDWLSVLPNPSNLDVTLSTRALEEGGNLASILAKLDIASSLILNALGIETVFNRSVTGATGIVTYEFRPDVGEVFEVYALGCDLDTADAGAQVFAYLRDDTGEIPPRLLDVTQANPEGKVLNTHLVVDNDHWLILGGFLALTADLDFNAWISAKRIK